jgi:predicted DNA binding CopG/RHH family protein
MKKRLTLTLPVEMIKYIKTTAKERGMTASQFVEKVFWDYIAEEEAKGNNLRKIS